LSSVAQSLETVSRSRHRRLGVGLCLSGGGYRSAIFHLGACRRLHELQILRQVELISSVSGGSILAAFLADRAIDNQVKDASDWAAWIDQLEFDQVLLHPFREIVSRDIRTGPVIRHALWNWAIPGKRARALELALGKWVSDRTMGELPRFPHFIFCATDLTHGTNWEFRRHRAGSWRAGYLDPSDWPLARAVAASACFPPVFGPIRIRTEASKMRAGRGRVAGDPVKIDLSDGGVYDNLGLEPAWKFCRSLLVSDCGAPFEHRSGGHYLGRLMRYTSVVTNQALALRKRMLFAGYREGRLDGSYWGLHQSAATGEAGYGEDLVGRRLSQVRTDLDRFGSAEFAVICNHGYTTADRAIQRNAAHLATPAALSLPFPDYADAEAADQALKSSHRRFSLKRSIPRRSP
jgi:NTE family protein